MSCCARPDDLPGTAMTQKLPGNNPGGGLTGMAADNPPSVSMRRTNGIRACVNDSATMSASWRTLVRYTTTALSPSLRCASPSFIACRSELRSRCRGQRTLEQRDLSGMVQVVLSDADELHVGRVGGLG